MEKPSPVADSNGDAASYKAVFIDTSLNTHLVTTVSSSDTVSDLKQKIMHEHPLCFPEIGEIKIHALKVKRRGCFYHLSDSMFVSSAFLGVDKSWFVSLDASSEKEHVENRNFLNPDTNNMVACIGMIPDGSVDGVNLIVDSRPETFSTVVDNEHIKRLTSVADQLSLDVASGDVVENLEIGCEHRDKDWSKIRSLDANNEFDQDNEDETLRTPIGGRESNSRNAIGDEQDRFLSERALDTGLHTKKKNKGRKKSKHAVHFLALKETNDPLPESGKDELQQEIVVPEVSPGNANKETGSVVQRATVLSEDPEVLGKHVECKDYNFSENNVNMQYDKSVEDTSQQVPMAKKKRKKENKCDELLKEDGYLISDSHKEMLEPPTISQHSLVDNQKNSNAILDGASTEILEAVHLHSAGPSSGKQKRKKRSSNTLNQEIAVVPSCRTNVKGETSKDPKDLGEEELGPGEHVHNVVSSGPGAVSLKEKQVDPVQYLNKRPSLQEFDVNNANARSAGHAADASGLALASHTKSMRVTEVSAINMDANHGLEVEESEKTEKEIEISNHEKEIQNDYQSQIADQTVAVEEKDSALNFSPTAAPSQNYKPTTQDGLDSKTSEPVDPTKSSKKTKKSKKTKQLVSGTEHAKPFVTGSSPTDPSEAANGDHSRDNVNKKERNVPPNEGKEVSDANAMSASFLATEKEIDDVIQNVVESVQQIGKGEVDVENTTRKSRKKTRKKQMLDVRNVLELEKENENAGNEVPTPSADETRQEEILSQVTKQSNLANIESINELSGSKLEGEKDTRIGNDPLGTQSSQIQQWQLETNNERRCHENETDDVAVTCESNRINFNDYFVPSVGCEIVGSGVDPVERAIKGKSVDGEMKANKNKKRTKKKLDAHSHGSSPDLQNSQRLNHNHGVKIKPQAGNVSGFDLEGSLSNEEVGKIMLQPNKEPSKFSDGGVKALPSSDSDKLPEEARRSYPVKPSGSCTHAKSNRAASNSSLESSKNTILKNARDNGHRSGDDHSSLNGRKPSTINTGEVVHTSQYQKNLGISSSIFKDDANEVSLNGEDYSDASTRTPSHSSLSSYYSDGESNLSQNGSYGWKRKEGGGKRSIKPLSSGMTLDTILRSSSRYKKARLTASQSLEEDTESQFVDVVPDSQANP